MSSITKVLFLAMLVTTFSLGILLVQTIGERDLAAKDLKNANAIIKEKTVMLKDETAAKEAAKTDFDGCSAQIKQINQRAAEEALARINEQKTAEDAASTALANLPFELEKDRIGNRNPEVATRWVRGLFQ